MRLESAMRSSREGLVAHGQAISVLGDNISNASTTGFKAQRAEFVDILGERVNDRTSTVLGGAGDGVAVGRVRLDFNAGPTNTTGRDLDAALTGAGFFLVGDPAAPQLTRVGSFQISLNGILTTSDGLPVLGYSGTDTEVLTTINMTNLDIQPQATSFVNLYGNVDGSAPLGQAPVGPTTFRDLNAQAAFVSTQSVYDSLGGRHDLQLFYFKTSPNQWTVQAYVNGEDVGQAPNQPVQLGQAVINFNNVGQVSPDQQDLAVLNLNPQWANGVPQSPFIVTLGNLTQFAGGSRIVTVQADGRGTGDVVTFEFTNDGKIFGTTVNGDRVQAGTLALGTVTNSDGLLRASNTLFSVTQESGPLQIGRPLVDGRGGMQGEALELSNVDLARQFVDMIVYQRGYQASSQVFSAASDLLKNTIAMIR